MGEEYKVHKVLIEDASFEALILELPDTKEEIEDRLTYFVKEGGNITKSMYEDFLITTCVANVHLMVHHIRHLPRGETNILKIRESVVAFILEHNPLLNPDNIIINKNSVLKIRSTEDELKENEKFLKDNKIWNTSYYDEVWDQKEVEEGAEDNEDPQPKEGKDCLLKKADDVSHEVVEKWWNKINSYIAIKKFSEKDINSLLGNKFFYNKSNFQTYIVSICVIEANDLFTLLDSLGVPNHIAPPKLMEELYEICKSVNPFLTFERAKEITGAPLEDSSDCEENCPEDYKSTPNRMRSHVSQDKSKKKKVKKKFKDVPKAALLDLAESMKAYIIGQDTAIDNIVTSIQRASVGLKDPAKPIGSFLFAGRTGCGKTKTCKVLANELVKDKEGLITIDCSEYSADHEYSKLIGCFIPGTKVLMEDGSRKRIENIVVGDKVITHKGISRNVEFVHEYNQDGEMLEITSVNSNIPETMTKTHEVLAIKSKKCTRTYRPYVTCKPTCGSKDCSTKQFENYNLEWLPAKDLEVGDVVAYPRYKPSGEYPEIIDLAKYVNEFTNYKYDDKFVWAQEHVKVPRYIKVDEDFMRLAGYYVSEGGSSGKAKSINFTFHSKEHDYIVEVVKLIRKVFGSDVRIRIKDRSQSHSYRIFVSSKIVCTMMSDLFGENTYVKKVPAWFKDIPDNLLKGFLETAVFGDGCLITPRRMDYSTVSEALHSQMELFFRRLGYITTTSLERVSKTKSNCKDRYRLYIGGSQIEKLNTEFNFDIDLSDMKLTNIQRMTWIDDDYVYKQIKKINTVTYTGKVYDLSVEEDVSYVLDFTVHNSPAGYVGYEQGGILTNAVRENPFSVIVFDEVEKASTKVHELMLQILDEGRLTDNRGQHVSFKDTIIIMTSNIGVAEVEKVKKTVGFGDVAKLTEERKVRSIDEAIKKKFKPEFINRIDSIVHFNSLTESDYMKIIEIELNKLNDNLKNNDTEYKDLFIEFDNKISNLIYKEGVDEEFGARPLTRCIERLISNKLAETLLKKEMSNESIVKVSLKNDKVTFSFKKSRAKK